MEQRDKLQTFILKSEEHIVAKCVEIVKNYRGFNISLLTNNSWQLTINNYSNLVVEAITLFSETANQNYSNPYTEPFLIAVRKERDKCLHNNIPLHIYISFLKIIRKAYLNIIENFYFVENEKQSFKNIINQCFDSLEISFTNAYDLVVKHGSLKANQNYSEILFEIIFEKINYPILIINSSFEIVRSNKAAKIISQNWDSVRRRSKKDGSGSLQTRIEDFIISDRKESNFEICLRINNMDGFFQATLCSLKETGNVLLSFIDVSRWKELEIRLEKSREKAEDSDKLKTSFLANMSHEIRTPMNAIVGFAELLTMSNPSPNERNEYLNLIKKSSNDLLNIIEDVIDVAKIESKQLKICPKNTVLFDILDDLHKLYSELLVRNGKEKIKLILSVLDHEKGVSIRTDPKRLKQALSNLLGNALKFTEQGQIEVGYKVAENKLVYFFVKDTGTGIPYNMQEKIFERFIQVDNDLDRNPYGTGLGLSICKNIVNLLGGNIWVSSVPNKGSNFYFFLPYIETSETPSISQISTDEQISDVNFRGFRILVAEDEDINFYYLRESLRNTGIEILRAKNGIEAINLSESDSKINLILMDIKMPEVNGLDATRYISHTRPDLPIVAITAYAMESDKKVCLEAGCVDYLSKPVMREKLIQILTKYLLKEIAKSSV